MPSQPSAPNSPSTFPELDLDLPVFDQEMPPYHELPLDWVYACNERAWKERSFDEAYFAASLARKNDVPFEM